MTTTYFIKDEEALRRLEEAVGNKYVTEDRILGAFRLVRSRDILAKTSDKVRSDRRIMMAAVKHDGKNLKHASSELKKDREIVLAAVQTYPDAILLADAEFRKDDEIMREALKGRPRLIEYADEKMRGDRRLIAELVKCDQTLFQFATEELRDDRWMALEAVRINPLCLNDAGEGPRNDREVALTAINGGEGTSILQWVGDQLMRDPSFAREVLKDHADCLHSFEDEVVREVARDEAVVLSMLKTEPEIMKYAADTMKNDREFAAKALIANAEALEYLDDDLKRNLCNDRDILLAAMGQKCGHRLLKYTGWELLNDLEFIKAAVKLNGKALNYFGKEAMKDEEIVISAFEHGYCNNGYALPNPTRNDHGYLVGDTELRKAIVRDTGRSEQEKCVEMAKKHKVRYLVHFTDVGNLGSILEHGMKTRKELEDRKISAYFSDDQRLDGQTDTISLSIEKPNGPMFAAKRNKNLWRRWCVLRLKPEAVLKNKCFFFRDNAANHLFNLTEMARDERCTVLDFLSMFEYDYEDRKLKRGNVQGEIMCTTDIPADAISSIVVKSEEEAAKLREQYGGKIPIVCDTWYFE